MRGLGAALDRLPVDRATDRATSPVPAPDELLVRVHAASICGTDLKITQEGLPDVIPADACHLGWQESLLQLAALVEPEIPAGT